MNRKTIRWARLAMATCAVAVFVGCDNSESAALDQNANAVAVRLAGGTGTQVGAELTSAGQGSLPVDIQSSQLHAQSLLSDARMLADALRVQQSNADALVSRISSLTSLANVAGTVGSAYQKMEPSASVSLIKDLSAKARGDGNVEKFSDLPNGSIPTLAAVKQEKSRLEGALAKAQGELQSATSQRDDLLKQVGTLSAKADEQKGQTRVDTVTQAAGLRQQAALSSRTINQLTETISRLTADLSVQANLETQLSDAVKSFDAQQLAIESGWKETKAKIDTQMEVASSILKADPTDEEVKNGQSTVKALAADLKAAVTDVDAKRGETLKAFDDAISKFTSAETGANAFSTSLGSLKSGANNPAEAAAWSSLASTINAQNYILQKAIALREQAAVHTSHAQFLLHLARVAESLETLPENLNAPVPEPFNSQELKKQATDAINKADELLTDAIQKVSGVSGTDDSFKSIIGLKYSTLIFLNYDRALLSQLALGAGLTAEVAKQTTYDESIAAAKTAITDARADSVIVPMVPSDIYVEPPKVAEEKPAEATPTAETPVADSPAVAELRQSLKDAAGQAATANDNPAIVDQLFARVKADDQSQPIVTSVRELVDAALNVQKAVKNKFGDEGVTAINAGSDGAPAKLTLEGVQKQIDAMAFTSADETHAESTLALPIPVAPTLKFLKEEEVWKLDLTGLPEPIVAAITAQLSQLTSMKDKLNIIAADVESGKLATIEDVKAALAALMPAGATTAPTETPTEAPASEGEKPAGANPTDGVAPGM